MTDSEGRRRNVLFLCTGNSCRSQMAEAFLRDMAGDRMAVFSAGLAPRPIHPLTVRVMDEAGLDIRAQRPEDVKDHLGRRFYHFVIVVCARANESCPRIWPGLRDENRLYWPFPDPAEVEGDENEKLAAFRRTRDAIRTRIADWLDELGE